MIMKCGVSLIRGFVRPPVDGPTPEVEGPARRAFAAPFVVGNTGRFHVHGVGVIFGHSFRIGALEHKVVKVAGT